jgi:hypothetical protein
MSCGSDLLAGGAGFQSRVSSVLNRNIKEYGKKHLFDGNEDTCWNSEQGSPQWVRVVFDQEVTASKIEIVFQGGFVGKNCCLEVGKKGEEEKLDKCHDFYPEDTNKLQTFDLARSVSGRAFRIVFEDSTDFFGRITVYALRLK